ncbi:MAG: ADP-ribosylglycohydrolase family protein [Planctomycetota bacterium]|nr:ADP-ribosylglycohydrolase family protein [Planctomycetota bacterium]
MSAESIERSFWKVSPDQIRGFFYAGAFGDAFGYRFENEGCESQDREDCHSLLSLSDDTQLTLATCEGLIESAGKVKPECIAASLARWFQERPLRGLGSSTAKALKELSLGGHWALVGAKGDRAAGAGAAMRVGPLAFFLDLKDARDRGVLRDCCRITHHHEEAYCGALAQCLALQSILKTGQLGLGAIIEELPDCVTRDRLTWLNKRPEATLKDFAEEFGATGYVADTVPLALAGALRMTQLGFEAVLWEFAELGGDVDTQCFLAAQCYGLQQGMGGLAQDQFERLIEKDLVEEHADGFLTLLGSLGLGLVHE